MHTIHCGEIWGGIHNLNAEVQTAGITAAVHSRSCAGGKGGDIYYLSVCEFDMLTRLAIADVQGHGESVAPLSGWLYEHLRESMNDTAGDRILSRMNGQAIDRGYRAITTSTVAAFYTADSRFYFTYAGHHPVLVNRRGHAEWVEALAPDRGGLANLPLGIDQQTTFDQGWMPLSSGDRLFLYTDGLIEAPDPAGKLWGLARLRATLEQAGTCSIAEIRSELLAALTRHQGGDSAHDDVTFLVVEIR